MKNLLTIIVKQYTKTTNITDIKKTSAYGERFSWRWTNTPGLQFLWCNHTN